MRSFILKSLIFILLSGIVINVRPVFLLIHDKYKNKVAGAVVYYSIKKSKRKNSSKKVLLGDSVGNQLFYNYTCDHPINSLACNQAIGLVGHFILLNNYLRTGNQVDTVFMLFTPSSFQNNLDQLFTYNYFIKPFYNEEYKPFFTETVYEQIHKIPYLNLCKIPYIITSDWAPRYNPEPSDSYTLLSPISAEYLKKICELGNIYHFKLIILCPPLNLRKKPLVDNIDKNEIVRNNLSEEFKYYFESIIYMDENNFIDGVHLKSPENYSEYKRTIFYKMKVSF